MIIEQRQCQTDTGSDPQKRRGDKGDMPDFFENIAGKGPVLLLPSCIEPALDQKSARRGAAFVPKVTEMGEIEVAIRRNRRPDVFVYFGMGAVLQKILQVDEIVELPSRGFQILAGVRGCRHFRLPVSALA